MSPASRTPLRSLRITAILSLAGVLLACEDSPRGETSKEILAPAPDIEAPPSPLPPAPVGRAELLAAIDQARSAHAAGQAQEGEDLAGQRFAFRQGFGCQGASEDLAGSTAGVARWARGRDQRSIEIGLTPADWTASWGSVAGGASWEAVEGYWLTHPWLRTNGCPAAVAAAPDSGAAAPPEVLNSGLASVFEVGSSRLGRREGRAFGLTLRAEPPTAGYRVVVEGRFRAFPDGRAIRCRSSNIDQAPVCVAAAEVDRVAFEDADGKLLKEWRLG